VILDGPRDDPGVDAEADDEAVEVQQQIDGLQDLDGLLRLAAVQVVDGDEDAAARRLQLALEELKVLPDVGHVADLPAVVALLEQRGDPRAQRVGQPVHHDLGEAEGEGEGGDATDHGLVGSEAPQREPDQADCDRDGRDQAASVLPDLPDDIPPQAIQEPTGEPPGDLDLEPIHRSCGPGPAR